MWLRGNETQAVQEKWRKCWRSRGSRHRLQTLRQESEAGFPTVLQTALWMRSLSVAQLDLLERRDRITSNSCAGGSGDVVGTQCFLLKLGEGSTNAGSYCPLQSQTTRETERYSNKLMTCRLPLSAVLMEFSEQRCQTRRTTGTPRSQCRTGSAG